MDRIKFWREKYIKEHKIYLIIGMVISAVLLYFIAKRAIVELSPAAWVVVFVVVMIFNVLRFMRNMKDYVNMHLMEEEQRGMQKGGFSTIPEDDPRYEDVE